MGFIYKIEVGGECYIGSTKKKYLSDRQGLHNYNLNNPNSKNYNTYLYRFCREYNIEKIICELLETVDDTELILLEQEYITMLEPTLNSYRVYRTEEQRLEQIRLKNKKHNNIKSNCPICGLEMLKNNIKRHSLRKHK
jgi:hypothetical protein